MGEMAASLGYPPSKRAARGKIEMADSLREQAWRFVCATFPERQIYIRSDGRVQFFTFGPLMQTILAGITLAFLGWVAFTSVNVVFKDHIIAAKDKRYQQMQASYETRVSDLQLAYDTLNGALVATEDSFKAKADELETKHRTLSDLIHRKEVLQAVVNNAAIGPASATGIANAPDETAAPDDAAGDSLGNEGDAAMAGPPPGVGTAAPAAPAPRNAVAPAGSEIPMMRQAPATDPRTARPSRASFLEGAVEKLAGALFSRKHASYANVDHPLLSQIAQEQARLNKLESAEQTLTVEAEQNVAGEISHLQGAIRMAGIDPNSLVTHARATEAMGGPLIPLASSSFTGVIDAAFNEHVAQIAEELDQLTGIVRAMHSVPLTMPVQGEDFHRSSGFGARIDPFTKRWAFHAGLDFTGPFGSIIHATAPGIVLSAGPHGPYGNAVDIDHGMGIKTRYGHLSAVLVRPGMKVDKGSPIGKLGSSGRSTGPHVHYEVWYDQAARDPARFIEAGRYVLKE